MAAPRRETLLNILGILLCLSVIMIPIILLLALPVTALLGVAGSLLFAETPDTFLLSSTSPGGITLEVWRENTNATEPFYLHVQRVTEGREPVVIYRTRGESEAEIEWLSDDTVRINGVALDATTDGYYYDDRRDPMEFTLGVTVEAEGVHGLLLEFFMDSQSIGSQCISRQPGMTQPFEPGERLAPSFRKRDLHAGDTPVSDRFSFTCTVVTADGGTQPLPFLWEWDVSYDRGCEFTLTGSAATGFTLLPEPDGTHYSISTEAQP